jgi:pimeloyl-ACP methyl ester carboxylesterase
MQQRRMAIPDVTLNVVDWRVDGATPVLCLHGITANARAFDGIAGALLPEFGVVAPDLRGRGGSDAPDDGYGIPAHVEDVLQMLDVLGIERVAVVGWSLGALVGLHLASQRPELVERLALLDPPMVSLSAVARESLGQVQARLDRVYASMDEAHASLRALGFLPEPWYAVTEAFIAADLHLRPDGRIEHRMRAEIVERERHARVPPLTTVLPNVSCPVLILRAPEPLAAPGDEVLSSVDAQRAARLFRNGRSLDIPGTNHYTIALGTPVGTIAALRAFLREARV